VQPPDPLDEWKSPPFEPDVRGNDIFCRGACDDKGQVYIQIKAVESLMKTHGKLPVNVKFLLEGEEETGGEAHRSLREEQTAAAEGRCGRRVRHRNVRARAAHHLHRPARHGVLRTVRAGRRSRSAFGRVRRRGAQSHHGHRRNSLRAQGPRRPHPNPGILRSRGAPGAKEREAWARLPFDEKEYTEKEMGARELVGEPGVPLFERVWARPTLEVHGIKGGFVGEGAKTVIPARAVAKISTRLVADQRVDEAIAQFQAAVRRCVPRA
jgi:acetylornithine deacetylase/succinyl-diaminopimelate desuccinylase-like protein